MNPKRLFMGLLTIVSLAIVAAFFVNATHKQSHAIGIPPQLIAPAAVGAINGSLGNSSMNLSVTGGSTNTIGYSAFNFGSGSLVTTGTNGGSATLNSASGTGSISCAQVYLAVQNLSGGTLTMGSGSASCTFPLYQTSGGSTGNSYYSFPQISNVNQPWIKLANSSSAAATADVELIYQQ
jgi:hypothetical protein